jgi:hypothetical protein
MRPGRTRPRPRLRPSEAEPSTVARIESALVCLLVAAAKSSQQATGSHGRRDIQPRCNQVAAFIRADTRD